VRGVVVLPRFQATSWGCRAKLPRAAIAESLVGPFGVVPFDPLSNGGAGFGEAGEVMRAAAVSPHVDEQTTFSA
jgi:hypothetical protein